MLIIIIMCSFTILARLCHHGEIIIVTTQTFQEDNRPRCDTYENLTARQCSVIYDPDSQIINTNFTVRMSLIINIIFNG